MTAVTEFRPEVIFNKVQDIDFPNAISELGQDDIWVSVEVIKDQVWLYFQFDGNVEFDVYDGDYWTPSSEYYRGYHYYGIDEVEIEWECGEPDGFNDEQYNLLISMVSDYIHAELLKGSL